LKESIILVAISVQELRRLIVHLAQGDRQT
jgi:hypothetical protein